MATPPERNIGGKEGKAGKRRSLASPGSTCRRAPEIRLKRDGSLGKGRAGLREQEPSVL
jgi:hypothetical protein